MTWNGPIRKIDDYRFEIPKDYRGKSGNLKMRVPGLVYVDEKMLDQVRKDDSLEQVANVATLPGIIGKSLAMPDIHWGYGFPIGGVAATDAEEGVISPGGVGFDINCGVRLVRTDLSIEDLNKDLIKSLVDRLFENVPSGLGSKGKVRVSVKELNEVLENGARWA
ncbi:MAG TPA: RNA-splicing ligase RtcB, partial [Firmicutes bacterium]|nr:RNA-splicing ligase RtcB [Bacillota bacterium]